MDDLEQRKRYPDPKPIPARRAKHVIEQLEANPRYAAAAEILRVLNHAMARIDTEIDVLNIERHLASRPNDPRASALTNRLRSRRESLGKAAAESVPAAAQSAVPASVAAALHLINDGVRPRRQNRQAEIAQLEKDKEVIRDAIFEQQPIVDALRDDLSLEAAKRHAAAYQKLVLAIYRAAQALATAADAEREFRSDFAASGHSWVPEIMRSFQLRATLILGSEHAVDSEISTARRYLEGAKILK